MSACFKTESTGLLGLAREPRGFDFLSKAEFAAGLDDNRGARGAEFGMFLHWDLIGRESGPHKDASGLALVIHGSKMGSGT
jgi:hypothetical protein